MLLPGQFSGLHVSVSVAEPLHDAPPLAAGVVSDLVRVLVPAPHVAVQLDHSPYSPHMQSITSIYKIPAQIIPTCLNISNKGNIYSNICNIYLL